MSLHVSLRDPISDHQADTRQARTNLAWQEHLEQLQRIDQARQLLKNVRMQLRAAAETAVTSPAATVLPLNGSGTAPAQQS
jgi:hypothetical protein